MFSLVLSFNIIRLAVGDYFCSAERKFVLTFNINNCWYGVAEDVVCKASRNLFIPVRLDNFVGQAFMIIMLNTTELHFLMGLLL